MLDVHPPHASVHTWRDFLIHIATITIGLLIALTLEGSVEFFHHRHLLRESRENLRQEIHDNQAILQHNVQNIHDDSDRMEANLAALREMRRNPKTQQRPHFTLSWSSFNESAWRTARDTGALSLMSYKDVQLFSDVYAGQDFTNTLAISIFSNQSRSTAPLAIEGPSSAPTPAQIDEVLHGCSNTLIDLRNLEQILQELSHNYQEAEREQ